MNIPKAAVLAGLLISATVTWAAEGVTLTRSPLSARPAWTGADDLRAKTLMPRLSVLPDSITDYNAAAAQGERAVQGGRKAGRGRAGADASHLRERRTMPGKRRKTTDDRILPEAVGSGGITFTSSSAPEVDYESLPLHPYSAVGKLFFKMNGAPHVCTGSLIQPGIVVTAAHCVHSGNGSDSGFYDDFQFVPGYHKMNGGEERPYGTWSNWLQVKVPNDWYAGVRALPHPHDFAIIVFGKDEYGLNVGTYTGWLGYLYPRMIGRQSTVIGYPANLDAGGIMHRIDSMVTDYGSLNNGTWGSDMAGGSDGGPVVQNFQSPYSYTGFTPKPSENESNVVTGVVSWVSTSTKVQGGSQFDASFDDMVASACKAHPAACI